MLMHLMRRFLLPRGDVEQIAMNKNFDFDLYYGVE